MATNIALRAASTPVPDYRFKPSNVIDITPVKREGTEITKLGKRMYAGAMVSRLTQDWIISVTSADAEILVSRKAVISRCRELERDNPLMEKILAIKENNVIGHKGIRLQMKVKGSDGKIDRDTCKLIEDSWLKYCRQESCTVTRSLTGIEVQNLAVRSFVRDGGILFRKHLGFDNDFKFAIEPIEIDRLDHDLNRPQTGTQNQIQFGIETDKYGAPLYYHILTRHPGDVFAYRASPKYRERVPADKIIFIFTPKRAGQMVGMPAVTSVMNRMNILDKYDQAEAVSAFIASCKGGFLERTNPDGKYTGDAEDSQGNTISNIEPGMIEELPPYVSYKANDPTHPTDAYPYFTKKQQRDIASGAGVTYHDLANDLEGVNFSSIRSGTLEAREGYKKDQQLFIDKLMQPWFEAWIEFAIMSRQVKLELSRLDDFRAAATWKGRRWAWVDPLKDVQANLLEVEGKLNSRGGIINESDEGGSFEDICEALENETEIAGEHGINLIPPAVKPGIPAGVEDASGTAVGGKVN